MEVGQEIIVYDENQNKLFEGIISDVLPRESIVYAEYNGVRKFDHTGKHGEALILTPDGAVRYNAKVGILYNKNVEIALHSPSPIVDGRAAPRYEVDIDFLVDHIYLREKRLLVPYPIDVKIKNISSRGMMFVSRPHFNISTRISYSFWASEDKAIHTVAEILRMNNLGNGLVEYACQFVDTLDIE